jgi:histidinol-phosphate aminotransferase
VPLTKSYHYDFDHMLAAINDKVDLVYLCHPNNPTGIAENRDELQAFVKEVAKSRPVMIDEAFIDCLEDAEDQSMKHLLPAEENVIIVRTFSKLWGMAGFRVGYLLGNPKLVAQLKSTVPALEMQSRFGAVGGMAAYGDEEFISMSRKKMRESQQQIYEILDRHGLVFIRSDCNFISFQVPDDSQESLNKMAALGVQLKKVSLSDNKNWLRVSCGKPEELAAFDAALGQIL